MKKFITTALVTLTLGSFILSGCLSEDESDKRIADAPFTGARLFVTTSDFTVGGTAVIYDTPPSYALLPTTSVSSDTAAKVYGTWVFVVNRMGSDNIQVLDALSGYKTLPEISVGIGTNAQDIALSSFDKAYVSRLEDASIWVGNPFTGAASTPITLATYADDLDGFPEAARMLIEGNRLFVALQRLYLWAPTSKSSIAVINTDTDQVVDVVDLETTNPVTRLIYNSTDSKIYVGCAGGYQSFGYPAGDGGVESISVDAVSGKYKSDGVLIDEITLGGDVNHLVVVSATQAYALVSDATFTNYLVRFNPQTVTVDSTLLTTSNWIADMILDASGYLYLADRDFLNPGVRIWDTTTDIELTVDPISTGLPPYSLATVQ